MKKALLILCSVLFTFSFFDNQINADEDHRDDHHHFSLPEEFTVTERWFSWTSTFDIETKMQKLGILKRRFFSLVTQYDFYDVYENLLSTARARFFSFGAEFDVKTADDKTIGMVEERIFVWFPTFRIYSHHGHILATARMNFWGTKYTVTSPYDENHVIAVMSRPFFSFRDTWTIKVLDRGYFEEKEIHPLLFMTIAAFQTDLDNWKRQARAAAAANSFEDNDTRSVSKQEEQKLFKQVKTFSNQVAQLKAILEEIKDQIPQIEPSEEDIAAVAESIDSLLKKENFETIKTTILELMTGKELTDAQKSAFFLLLDRHTKELLDIK